MHCRIFSNFYDLYPLDAKALPCVITKILPDIAKCSQVRIADLNEAPWLQTVLHKDLK